MPLNSVAINGDSRNIITLWDDKQVDKFPQVKIRNLEEFDYSLRLDEEKTWGSKYELSSGYKKEKNKIYTLENSNFKDECYTTSELFEWLIYIKKAPKDGKIYFSVINKDIEWYYQGALTDEEIKEGAIRPDEIVGSYALYCPKSNHIKGRKNYMAGKVGHIPAPYFIDNEGKKIKGKMYLGKNTLIIEIPESLIGWDYKKEPLLLDPTFGYTTAGASNSAETNVWAHGKSTLLYTASTGDTITKFTLYGYTSSGTTGFKMAAYTYVSGNPNTRLAAGVDVPLTTSPGWRDSAAVSQSLTNGVVYTTAFGDNGANTERIYYDSGVIDDGKLHLSSSLPATFSNFGGQKTIFSMYSTVEAGGGSTSNIKKRNTISLANIKKVDSIALANIKKIDTITK